jgi:hypothetical protein
LEYKDNTCHTSRGMKPNCMQIVEPAWKHSTKPFQTVLEQVRVGYLSRVSQRHSGPCNNNNSINSNSGNEGTTTGSKVESNNPSGTEELTNQTGMEDSSNGSRSNIGNNLDW